MSAASQKERMLAGELYRADDPELAAAHLRAQTLFELFNQTPATDKPTRRRLLAELFGGFGDAAVIEPPFRCDYGFNISLGDRSFVNYDAVWLGGRTVVCPGVTIGAGTVVGAGSVVVKDLPAGVLAVGDPCRVVRSL